MSIHLGWYHVDSQEILHYIFYPNWVWAEIYQLKKRADRMLQLSKHAIPVFFDFRLSSQLPPGMLNHGRQIVATRHPQGSPLVIVGGERLIYNTFKIAERMLNDPTLLDDVVFTKSMPEAEHFIRAQLYQQQV
ncbi:MAG: hypothetical protein Q9P44_17040 [Anaerolineae bacterium]|nr:hypothetical protein [Anaerolineae bacterium]